MSEQTKDQVDIIATMRETLRPSGTAQVVRLHLSNHFFDAKFVTQCIDELEKVPARVMLGYEPSKLELLAYALLKDSAYIS